MDIGEHLKSLEAQKISLKTQQDAKDFLAEFQAPIHITRATEAGGSFIQALGRDLLELTTVPMRVRTYRLQRQVGLSTLQAVRHSSPAEGLVTAALILPKHDH